MKAVRVALALAGLAALVRGLVLLVDLGPRLPAVLVWALGGIVLHDGVLAPLVVLLGVLAASRTPAWLRAPLVGLLVVLGPLTLVAVPVLGRFGARYDNATLLDRPYWSGYVALVALGVVVTAVVAERRRRSAPPRP
ncbi:hypothetical protein [Nostocoides sp. Soil756]|uniref:hypothetical protein n=1 Tax=Nostocoides sp. Soil756 TaxID=1736399 RepID=UPI0006F73C91|nr:hypothetical protein [Tetrasphaera sp. Soil756]KRE63410.1 hypothetical protein ASG78_00390 [Tetrasphaera sp. Soil756]